MLTSHGLLMKLVTSAGKGSDLEELKLTSHGLLMKLVTLTDISQERLTGLC